MKKKRKREREDTSDYIYRRTFTQPNPEEAYRNPAGLSSHHHEEKIQGREKIYQKETVPQQHLTQLKSK